MLKEKPQNPHPRILLYLFLLSFFLINFNITACSGQKKYSGKEISLSYPPGKVRSAFIRTIEEVGGKISSESAKSDTITGTIEGYSFRFKLLGGDRSSTRAVFRVSGKNGDESQALEALVVRVLRNKLSVGVERKREGKAHHLPSTSRYEKATVCLYGSSNRETFQSSGIVISGDGLVITTAHEISEARTLFVKWPDKKVFKGRIKFISSLYDLALVETHVETTDFIPLRAPKSIEVPIGQRIYTIGCPYGLIGTLAQGRIAASPRVVGDILLYQCDLPVYPGNSGGPVFDSNGELIGLVKGRLKDTDTISFIIPSFYLSVFLKENLNKIHMLGRSSSVSESRDWIYWFGLGLAASSNSTKESAFKKVLSMRPGFTPALYHLGLVLNRQGKLKEELGIWKELVNLVPRWSEAWYRLGNADFKLGNLKAAEAAYRKAMELSPNDPRYYNNLGEIYRRKKKFKKAEIYFKKALSLYPQYALAHYNLGVLFDQALDKPELAVYHYKKYLELCPGASDKEKVTKWIEEAERRF